MEEPAAYGKFGLANLLELREECLREFQFVDAYISIKQRLASSLSMCSCTKTCSYLSIVLIFSAWRENEASLAVLPDLLMELDTMNEVCDILASSCLILHLTEGILIYVCMISWVIILTIMPFFYWQCMYIKHQKLGSYQNHKSLLTKYLLMCYWQNWPLSQLGYVSAPHLANPTIKPRCYSGRGGGFYP